MDMDNDSNQHLNSAMASASESNLGGVLFSDYSSGNLILTSDISGGLSSFEGTLCFDETNNELVYVNMPVQMISSNVGHSDTIANCNSSLSPYSATSIPSLSDLPLFNEGGQVMLFTGGSIVIPNDDENLIPSNSDPFILEYVLNSPQLAEPKTNDDKSTVAIELTEIAETNGKPKNRCSVQQNEETSKRNAQNSEKKDDVRLKKNMKHSCKLCFEKFGSLKDYKKHLTNHNDHKMHECKLCGVSFNKINNLVLHQVAHSNDTKCPLLNCQKKFNRKASLKAHVKLHEEDESLTCSECGEEFRNQLYLELHYKYQSQCRISSLESVTRCSQNKTFFCKLCDRNFERAETFNAHKKEHEKLKKALATKSHKKKAAPTVPSSRINRCKMCPKWFLKPSQLVRHMRIHTGERPFVCDVCSKAFNQANSLKIHMLKHTGDRPFQCTFCGTSFSQRGNLRQHINRVHSIPRVEEKVYKCSECPCMFKKMCSLNAHKNRVHQQLYVQNGSSVAKKFKSNENEPVVHPTDGCTAITIENGVDDVNDEDMSALLDKDSDINTISINFDDGKGAICNQKVLVEKRGNARFYRCSHCPKVNVKLKEIIRHLKLSILGKPFKCDHCSKTFSQQSTFLTHLTLHATAETYQCAVCDRCFSSPLEMKIHLKLHGEVMDRETGTTDATSNESFFKNQSNNRFSTANAAAAGVYLSPSSSNIQLHANAVAAPANIATANAVSTKKSDLSERARLRDTVNLILPPYDCKFCNVRFESYAKLKQHLRAVHDANICHNCCADASAAGHDNVANSPALRARTRTCLKGVEKLGAKNRRYVRNASKSDCRVSANDVECQFCGKMFKVEDCGASKRTKTIRDEYAEAERRRRHRHQQPSPTPLDHHLLTGSSQTTNAENVRFELVIDNVDVGVHGEDENDARVSIELTNDIDNDNADAIAYGGDADEAVVDATASENRRHRHPVEISVTSDDGHFAVTNAVQIFSAGGAQTSAVSRGDGHLDLNETTALFDESQISVNENVENCIDLADDGLKSELLTLDTIEGDLFEFQTDAIPIEMDQVDADAATTSSNQLLNSAAGAVIYKSTKCYQESFAETDAQKEYQELDCLGVGGETNTFDSYFYACNTCYLTFRNLPTLLRHLQTHDGCKSFECLYCGTENKTQAQLTHHIAQHSLHKEYPCVHCGDLFDSLDAAKKHITDIHLMSSVDKKCEQKRKKNSANDLLLSEKEKIQIACQKPHKYSSISEKVLSSLLKNNNCDSRRPSATDKDEENAAIPPKTKKNELRKMQKENVCSYCSRSFKKMCDLVRHIRIHTGEKPFKCDYCSKCFTVKSILNCHLKTHFSVNNIFCHVCNRFFATVGSLKTHMRLHTGERPYKCLYCKETFRTSGHRDSHQKRHLGDKDKCKWKCSAESALIEIEDNACLDVSLEAAGGGGAPNDNVEYIIPEMMDADANDAAVAVAAATDNFEFQDIDLTDLDAVTAAAAAVPARKRCHWCVICRKTFKKKSDLDRHSSVHANEKAFRCEICDSAFNRESALKTHLRTHTRIVDDACRCDQCGGTFVSMRNLKAHQIRHHPQDVGSNAPPTPAKDRSVQIVQVDKDVDRWCENAEMFAEKMVDLKKYDGAADFYTIDRHFDLNTMMSDLFPDDEKQ